MLTLPAAYHYIAQMSGKLRASRPGARALSVDVT